MAGLTKFPNRNTGLFTHFDESDYDANDSFYLGTPRHSLKAGSAQRTRQPASRGSTWDSRSLNDGHSISSQALVERADDGTYVSGLKLGLLTLALCLAVFLFALDNTIIGVAIPKITDEFLSLDDIGWYGSAYLVTTCALQPIFGKLYTVFPIKPVYLTAVAIFEIGSLVCGAAPSSVILIIGRALAGVGCAGIYSGSLVIIAHTVPLHRRPLFTGLVGGMYGIASVAGPLLGGVFTDKLSWRWCFYINLPLGLVTLGIITLLLKIERRREKIPVSWLEKLKGLDLIGTAILLPAVICILLGLQWGGSKYEWSNFRVVALFVFGGILALAFCAVEYLEGDQAAIAPRILMQRSIACAALFNLCIGAAFLLPTIYLPIWFQAMKGVSAVHSGVDVLPLMLGAVIFTIVGGALVTTFGYYSPFMIASSIFMAVGSGLLTTLAVDMSMARLIGYQLLYAIGIGLGLQLPIIASQTVLPLEDVPSGTAIIGFFQSLGGAILLSVAQSVFTNDLVSGLTSILPNMDAQAISSAGATDIGNNLPAVVLEKVRMVYNDALAKTFFIAVAVSVLSMVGAVIIESKSVKQAEKLSSASDKIGA